jgi:glucose/arabinose dehydrogenase
MQALLHGFLSCRIVVAWLSLALLPFSELRLAQADTYAVQSAKHVFQVNKVLDGLENPWSMAFLPVAC